MSTPVKTPTLKEFLISTAIGIAPVVIVILMSKPALRQAISMRVALAARNFAISQAEFWKDASFTMARVYDKTRL
jgi:hypothetical protein